MRSGNEYDDVDEEHHLFVQCMCLYGYICELGYLKTGTQLTTATIPDANPPNRLVSASVQSTLWLFCHIQGDCSSLYGAALFFARTPPIPDH